MAYIITNVYFETGPQGEEEEYEVGADVEPELMYGPRGDVWTGHYSVGEPEFSAPGGTLATSRLAFDPQGGGLPDGWSELVEGRLVEEYQEKCERRSDDDFYEPDDDYMSEDVDHSNYIDEEF
jgi:hypothetical protein